MADCSTLLKPLYWSVKATFSTIRYTHVYSVLFNFVKLLNIFLNFLMEIYIQNFFPTNL